MAGASPGKGHFHRKPFLSDQTARLTQRRRLSASIFAYNERTQGVSVKRTSRYERCGRSRGAVTCAGVSPTLDPCPCFCFTTDRHRIDVTSGYRQCVRAAKEMASKSIGLCPQGFESPRCRLRYAQVHVKERYCGCAPVKIAKPFTEISLRLLH